MVNVYSSRHYDTDRALYDGFTQATGVRVRLIEGDADQLIERIRNEGPNSPADVLITVDAARLERRVPRTFYSLCGARRSSGAFPRISAIRTGTGSGCRCAHG